VNVKFDYKAILDKIVTKLALKHDFLAMFGFAGNMAQSLRIRLTLYV